MRLLKFRCKNKVGNWCFFTVLHDGNVNEENFDLETLSEFTGLFDKRGVEIYEGDVVKHDNNSEIFIGFVKFEEGCFGVYDKEKHFDSWVFDYDWEVIGNIYENTELLETSNA